MTKEVHTCLLIPEILQKIRGEMRQYIQLEDSHRALSAMSRTCKTFQEPALNALYLEIVGLERLFSVLPRDAWSIQNGRFELTRTLRFSDWEVLCRNFHRVRRFHQPGTMSISEAVFHTISFCPYFPLLPNLQQLRWDNTSTLPASVLRFLCAPEIKEVGFNVIPASFFPFITTISIACPELRKLQVRQAHGEDVAPTHRTLMEALSNMRNLQHLNIDTPMSDSLLQSVQVIPSIRSLVIQPLRGTSTSIGHAQARGLAFCNLSSLCIHHVHLVNATGTLDAMGRLSQLKEFTCISRGHPTPDISNFLRTVMSRFDRTRLSTLSLLEDPDTSLSAASLAPLDFEVLKPLMSWKNLEKLAIWTCIPFSLDDYEILILSSSWPKLRSLNFGTRDGWGTEKKPSLKGLTGLLDNCPNLEELHLVIDAFAYYDLPPFTLGRNRNTIALFLDDSPLEDPLYVSSFLHLLLPNLYHVNTREEDITADFKERWAAVNNLLSSFHTMAQYRSQWSAEASRSYGQIKAPKPVAKWNIIEEVSRSTSLFS